MRIFKDLQDIGRLWERICEDSQDLRYFGRGFVRLCETLGDFGRLWERIWETWDTLG